MICIVIQALHHCNFSTTTLLLTSNSHLEHFFPLPHHSSLVIISGLILVGASWFSHPSFGIKNLQLQMNNYRGILKWYDPSRLQFSAITIRLVLPLEYQIIDKKNIKRKCGRLPPWWDDDIKPEQTIPNDRFR